MKKKINLLLFLAAMLPVANSFAHCEIPCGIYGDSVRIVIIAEHITTIEKSMKQINELSEEEPVNYNQIVRWVTNKEDHANKIQEIVSQYFLHQRIKHIDASDDTAYKEYTRQLVLLHELLVYSMKTKQTTDISYIKKMRTSLKNFEDAYFHKH